MEKVQDLYHPTWEIFDSSKVQCFMDCPRKYFYQYILGWDTNKPNHDLIFGQAFHEAMEYLMTHSMTEDSLEPAYECFLKKYREYFPEETDEIYSPKAPTNLFMGLASYIGNYRNQDNFRTLYVEVGGKVSTGKHTIVYKLDSICEDQNGRIFSFEHKSTKMGFRQVWFDEWLMSLQIGTYSYALRCLYPELKTPLVIVNGVSFSKKKVDCARQPVKKTPNQLNVWLLTVNYWISQIKNEINLMMETNSIDKPYMDCFPMNPRACTNYFRLCPFHDFCMAWPNPIQKAMDGPPEGFAYHFWNPLEELEIKTEINLET